MSYAGANVERPMQPNWEHFPHEADMGVRGIGSTKEAAFERAADALTGVITDPGSVAPTQSVPIVCEAPDDELLLVDWPNALVYEVAMRKMLFRRFNISVNDQGKRGEHRRRVRPFPMLRYAADHCRHDRRTLDMNKRRKMNSPHMLLPIVGLSCLLQASWVVGNAGLSRRLSQLQFLRAKPSSRWLKPPSRQWSTFSHPEKSQLAHSSYLLLSSTIRSSGDFSGRSSGAGFSFLPNGASRDSDSGCS